jgi:hypothetical protein
MTDLNRLAEEYLEDLFKTQGVVFPEYTKFAFQAGFRAALECEEVRALYQALGLAQEIINTLAESGSALPTTKYIIEKCLTEFDKLKEQK